MRKHVSLPSGKRRFRFWPVCALLAVLAAALMFPAGLSAASYDLEYTNTKTGYRAYIRDEADKLTASEEKEVMQLLQKVTEFGNAEFLSVDYNPSGSAEQFVISEYLNEFGSDSGAMFLLDMDTRMIMLRCHGAVSKIVDNSYTDTITDNVYTYASRGQYGTCVREAFSQVLTLLQGGRIAQPMKIISNALLAILLAMVIVFIIIKVSASRRQASTESLLSGGFVQQRLNNPRVVFTGQTRVYVPPVSSSGGGGGHSGGGHSGGGGGHSGGGGGSVGGHSF